MKKLISVVMIGLLCTQIAWMNPYDNPYNQIQYVQEYRALSQDAPTPVDFTGDKDFAVRANQYNFTDVTGNNKIAAAQLAVFDISKGQGNRKFAGGASITNIEAITMFVRLFGNDATLRQSVVTSNPGLQASKLTAAFNDAYYGEAKRLGILGPTEEVSYTANANRENLAVWLVRASGVNATFSQNALYKASDWQSVRVENLPAIETVVDLKLMGLESGNRFNPKGSMTRQTFAVVLDKVFEQFSENLGLTTKYGIIVGQKDITDPTGVTRDIYVRNVDNTLSHIQVKTPKTGIATGLVVYKGGLTTHAKLVIGDEIKYTIKDGIVRYTLVLSKDEVKDRLLEFFKSEKDTVTRQGQIKSVTAETIAVGSVNQSNTRIRIENDDDTMVDLLSLQDNVMGLQNRFLVVNGKSYIDPSALKRDGRITYVTKGDKILYASLGKSDMQSVKGTLRFVDMSTEPPQVVIFDQKNTLKVYNVAKDVEVSINFYKATLADLKPGAPTSFTVLNNEVVNILSDSYQPVPGYIPNDGKIRMATVQSVSGTKIVVKGDNTIYEIGPATGIYKETQRLSPSVLKNGDQVKLYFDNMYSAVPSKVVIEGKEQLITKILKGNVFSFNQFTNQIGISDRSRLQNTLWVGETDPSTALYNLAASVEISDNGKPVSLTDLSRVYIKKPAYFVIRDNFGSKEIVQMVFNNGSERNFKDAIQSYSNVLNRLVLKSNRTIQYDDQTIFIQNNRVVDKSVLANNVTVHAVTNTVNGADVAQVIRVIGRFDTIFDRVFVGAVDEVYSYSFNLANYSTINDFNWQKTNEGQKLLNLSDDTSIYNSTKSVEVTREAFFNGAYSRSENDSIDGKGLAKERFYGVFVTDGKDQTLAMRIRFKELIKNDNIDDALTQEPLIAGKLDSILKNTTFTTGTIGEFNPEWKRIGLVDSQNFLRFHGEWVANTTLTYIELTDSLIIKNDKVIKFEDLALDDVVYIVRDDEDALVVFVEP